VIRLVGRGCRLSRRRGRGRGRGLGCRAGGLLLVRGAALAALTGGGELVRVEAVVGEVACAAGRGARGQTIGHGAGEVVPAEVERAEAVQPREERGGQRARQPVVLELEPRVGVRVRVRVRVRAGAAVRVGARIGVRAGFRFGAGFGARARVVLRLSPLEIVGGAQSRGQGAAEAAPPRGGLPARRARRSAAAHLEHAHGVGVGGGQPPCEGVG
jgi:hypothetical protein